MRDSGNVKGIQELTATGEAGLTKIWALMWDGKENDIRKKLGMRHFRDKCSRYGILVKKGREYVIRASQSLLLSVSIAFSSHAIVIDKDGF